MKTIVKTFIVLGLMFVCPGIVSYGQININNDGTPADASAMLDMKSTTRGMLIPRMTASQRTGIASPANGLMVYQTDGNAGFYFFNAAAWKFLGFGPADGYSGNVIDIDGNAYPTVKIGNQEWMARNLRTTHFRNGDAIPEVTENAAWNALSTAAYCWYDNDYANYSLIYGALYNFYAVKDGRNLCPVGWHISTDAEWTTLISYLGGETIAGGKLKADLLWNSPNTSAINSVSFSAFPGGYRYQYELSPLSFLGIGQAGAWWTSAEDIPNYSAWVRGMDYNSGAATHFNKYDVYGYSVRCVRD
ncbi:MAG: fibrobacter succinogenes major paralogous domain-containing protein [Bacteroidota bacterium]